MPDLKGIVSRGPHAAVSSNFQLQFSRKGGCLKVGDPSVTQWIPLGNPLLNPINEGFNWKIAYKWWIFQPAMVDETSG